MKNTDKAKLVTAAQIALGEQFTAPFWGDVERELDAIKTGNSKSKSQLKVEPRRLTPTSHVRHY